MATALIKKLKPTSPARRFVTKVTLDDLHKGSPLKGLTSKKVRISGRNNQGRITVRHRGGGHARLYRKIDFKRQKDGVPGRVICIEYDPNRTAYIARILYADGEWSYILAPTGLAVNDLISSGVDAPIEIGNCLPLQNIPLGSTVHCIELKPGKGGQLIRSAGTSAQLVGFEEKYAILRLRSTEMRKVLSVCRASIGSVSNSPHNLRSLGKAGASRHRGIRPTVRGIAMNPVDHPHGGGEGRSKGCHPVSPTGVQSKGFRTRSNKRTDHLIIRRRKKRRS